MFEFSWYYWVMQRISFCTQISFFWIDHRIQKEWKNIFSKMSFYRPHPKDGDRHYFQFVCQFTLAGDTPIHWPGGGVSFQVLMGIPPSFPMGGLPILPNWGVPHPSWWGYLPSRSQVRLAGYSIPKSGYPLSWLGRGYSPILTWDGGNLHPDLWWGYPPVKMWEGVLPSRLGKEVPPLSRWGPRTGGTPKRKSMACTCYAAGGMPLAFT